MVLPRYGSGSLSDIVPVLCAPGGTVVAPPWMPSCVHGAERVVLLLLDGLGWNQFQQRMSEMPSLREFEGGPITTIAPSTTAAALTSLVTGLPPAEHGLIGYRVDMGGTVMNVLRWGDSAGDLRGTFPPERVQACPPFLGLRVPVLSRAELEGTGFTLAHLSGVKARGWRMPSSIAVGVRAALDEGERFVYVYYDGVDKIAHERGFGEYYDAELRAADSLVESIVDSLPADTVLLVTADHGQVHVGSRVIALDPDVQSLVSHQSGEGRFRWLHARRGRAEDLRAAAAVHGDLAWVVGADQVVDEEWFGPRMGDVVRRRLGDVALVAREPVSFEDPAEAGGPPLICRHGSMTADEMFVPLVAKVA